MLLYNSFQAILARSNYVTGPRLDLPGPFPFQRDVEDIKVGGKPLDHVIAAYNFADFGLQIGIYTGETGVRVYYRGAYTVFHCSRLYLRFLVTAFKIFFNITSALTLGAVVSYLSASAWFTAFSLRMGSDFVQFLNAVRNGAPLPSARQALAAAIGATRNNAARLRGRAAGRGTARLCVALARYTYVRSRRQVLASIANIPRYNPAIGLLPQATPNPQHAFVSACLCAPMNATVVIASNNAMQLDYRSVKGKKGFKVVSPVAVQPAPVVQVTDTLVHIARPLVKLDVPFGPWFIELPRFVGEQFSMKYIDNAKSKLIVASTPGRYGIKWGQFKEIPFPYPVVPVPPLLVVKRGAPFEFWLPDKMIRELDIPKLTSRQTNHDVFLQRLDQASRAIKHEYKDITDNCLNNGGVAPNIAVAQVVGLNCKLQNERTKNVEDFLRGH